VTITESKNVSQKIEIFRQGEVRLPRSVFIFKTSWYPEITQALVESAIQYLRNFSIPEDCIELVPVPGSYEIPFAMASVFSSPLKPDMAIALGCVVKGGTPHFDFVCQTVARGVSEVSIQHRVPTGFGVLTVDNLEQAKERVNKGQEAAHAALSCFNLVKSVKGYF
jgi:6,7-dimethyl-8-ribityllumazine synthase